MAKIGGHERGYGRIEVALSAHNADIGKLRHVLARQMVHDASPQRRRSLTRAHELHKRDRSTTEHCVPACLRSELTDVEPGLLLELARDAALEIDAVDRDVVEIRRAAGKVDLTGIEGVRAHLAYQEGAV